MVVTRIMPDSWRDKISPMAASEAAAATASIIFSQVCLCAEMVGNYWDLDMFDLAE